MKQRGLKCQFQKCEKRLWPHSQTTPTDSCTFESEIYCDESGERCDDEFTVVEGPGKVLLGKNTAKKLNVLRVQNSPHAYSIKSDGKEKDMHFSEVFTGLGKL